MSGAPSARRRRTCRTTVAGRGRPDEAQRRRAGQDAQGRAGWWPRSTRPPGRSSGPGVTTLDIDRAAREVLEKRGAGSNFLGYHGFPAVVCTSPELDDRPRHPVGLGRPRRGRHHLRRLRRHHRGLPRGRRLHRPGGGGHGRGRPPDGGHRGQPVRRHRPARPRATASTRSAGPSSRWPRRPGSRWCASTWATPSARPCTRSPRYRTTGRAPRARPSRRGMVFAIEPMVNAGGTGHGPARRRLERGHLGRPAVGPFRAHHRRDRRRSGDLHRPVSR